MSYLDSLLPAEKQYTLPDGSSTSDFLVWHNIHSTQKVDISAVAKKTLELNEPEIKKYELRDGSFTTDFWTWHLDHSASRIGKISEIANNKLDSGKKQGEVLSTKSFNTFQQEQAFRRYQLADGSYTSDFIVYHNDQENNEEGIKRRLIKKTMESFEHFVGLRTIDNHLQEPSFFTGKKTDTSFLAEKTYYLFGVTFNFILFDENNCYEDQNVGEFHRMANEFTEKMLTLNNYDPKKPLDIVKFLENYMKTYPKMHPESLKNFIYFPRK